MGQVMVMLGRFQPTLPLRGATSSRYLVSRASEFQPTLPLRGATARVRQELNRLRLFQPTLPLRGATFINMAGNHSN